MLKRCSLGGWLGGTKYEISDDPTDYNYPHRHLKAPCSNLRCNACESKVLWRDGVYTVDERILRAGFYDKPDPLVFDEFRDGINASTYRTYYCRCAIHAARPLWPLNEGPGGMNRLPRTWRCAGHPAIEFPTRISTLTISTSPNWDQIVLEHLDSSDNPDRKQSKIKELSNLWGKLQGSTDFEELATTIRSWLHSDDNNLLGLSIAFHKWFPKSSNASALLRLGEQRLEELGTIANPIASDNEDLRAALLSSMGALIQIGAPYNDLVKQWMREQGERKAGLKSVRFTLIDHDMNWTITNFKQLATNSPIDAVSTLGSLARRARKINWNPSEIAQFVSTLPDIDEKHLAQIVHVYC